MKILAVLFGMIASTIAFAGVDGKSYDVPLDTSVFRFSFRSGTAFITSGGYEWNFPYSEPDPIGSISGIPFYLDGEKLTLILATATGTESTHCEPDFRLSYVASIPAYLWHGAVRGSDVFWGSYVQQSGDDPSNPELTDRTATWQRYYKMSPPYSSYVTYKLTDSGNHESCKPFFWESNQLVLTERGAVYAYGDNVNRTFVGDYRHYLLAVNTWNGVPWFAWNPATFAANNGNSGTQLWYWDGSKPVYSGVSIPDIMTFHLLEHDGYMYLFGQHPDYDSGRIYRVNPDLSTQCLFSGGAGFHHAISYAGSLYAGAGSRNGGTASIYRLEGDTFYMVEAMPKNINNFGTFAQFQGHLFASGVRSGGSAVLMKLSGSGWETVFTESDFTSLKSTAGTSSSLIQPSGFMVATDKLYIMLNDINGGRYGPSHLFAITAE